MCIRDSYTTTINTGNITFNPNGAINWGDNSILTFTFDNPVDFTIADDLGFWQLFNGFRTSITTNGNNFDVSNFSFANVTNTGQVITYSGASSAGSTGWGSLIAPNTTEVVIQGVGVDQLIFTASKTESVCEAIYSLQNQSECEPVVTSLLDTDFTLDGAILFNGGLRFGAAGVDGGSAEAITIASIAYSNELSYEVIAIGGVFPDHELTAEVLDSNGNVLASRVTTNITGTASLETLSFASTDSNITAVSYTHLTLPTKA